ncbi:RRXRR domain-containing protein [Burkholderia vietnamiensis]|uniref:RRXRR domain-containing protein n=1 Tax=Burkholderia vietnamiensis TaxID=60552 RepID=UPI001FC9F9CF|nr:RRXRR domain-containing protein [Burkholderia vietnamiensis]
MRANASHFLNRGNQQRGWLAPPLQHRVDTCIAWVLCIQRWAQVTALNSELVRFDMQTLQNPEISGIEYQQSTLFGHDLREYLL